MKLFLKKILLILVLFIGSYCLIFFAVEKGLKNSNYLDFEQWNNIYNGSINSEVIILGSSRAWKQVNPAILSDKLNLSCYNLGMDGYQIPMQIKRFEIYSNYNKRPKLVVQILDHFSFTKRSNLFNMDQFLPYFDDTSLVSEIKQYEGYSWPDYYLPY